MKTAIGGDRLGSGNKENISTRNYERSTHDLNEIFRSSMSAGTLVPFLLKVALPGDSWDIDLNCEVVTLPTVGPLFGSYKVQLDVFCTPMRLYNSKLHMNRLGIGMDMSQIKLPQIGVVTNNHAAYVQTHEDNEHINPSCLLKYLGISGLGHINNNVNPAKRYFNAVPLLTYWDIYKNYYSNKQEEVGYIVHSDDASINAAQTPRAALLFLADGRLEGSVLDFNRNTYPGSKVEIHFPSTATEPLPGNINCNNEVSVIEDFYDTFEWDDDNKILICTNPSGNVPMQVDELPCLPEDVLDNQYIRLAQFNLDNIDGMKDAILGHNGADAYKIEGGDGLPYNGFMDTVGLDNQYRRFSCQFSQEGLGIKTYQSDMFNNWINTEWLDGTGGINEITAVSTIGDSFSIDALNLASKVYNMLNRIAISGGSYDDWLDAVYTHKRAKAIDSPVYYGSLIKELAFEEVISNADTQINGNTQPLGTLAGRGRLTQKNKGGKIRIKTDEPCYIMGIVSLTPRIDYSQGNNWDVNLKTFNDFHKPALDGIGFQELITEQMLWTDSTLDSNDNSVTYKSLGKQPAWLNYMTSVNKCFGNFADENKEMFMTLNRRYEASAGGGTLLDGTTYIDPTKFNHIFAQTSLDSQNFWVQIASNITARRKMSAKIIPNL